jgi:hypothetical protein
MRSFFLTRFAVVKHKQLSATENGEYAQVDDLLSAPCPVLSQRQACPVSERHNRSRNGNLM